MVNLLPYRYGLNCFVTQTIESNSFSVVLQFVSSLLSVQDVYEIGKSEPILPYERIAPIAKLLAFVVIINGMLKLGYFKSGSFVSKFLK